MRADYEAHARPTQEAEPKANADWLRAAAETVVLMSRVINQFIIGGLKLSLSSYTDEDELISRLRELDN